MDVGTSETQKKPIQVLLVEDNPGDILLARRAFKQGGIVHEITVAPTGEDALCILRRESIFKDAVRPDLILLDLNLPKMNGQDVLAFVKNSNEFKDIPVIVLSSSWAERDVLKSYDLHANGYIVKPMKPEAFLKAYAKINKF